MNCQYRLLGRKNSAVLEKLVNTFSGKKSLLRLVNFAKMLRLTPHNSFYITPWWSSHIYSNIISEFIRRAHQNDSFLVGAFHPSDIINPKTKCKNLVFEKCISRILEELCSIKEVDVTFLTLSNMAKQIEKTPL